MAVISNISVNGKREIIALRDNKNSTLWKISDSFGQTFFEITDKKTNRTVAVANTEASAYKMLERI